jgi:hypothetical protein
MVSMGIPEEWLVRDEAAELPESFTEPPEVRELRMMAALLDNY